MREKTYHLYLNEEERSRVIQSLIELKNNLAAQGRYTDAVDDTVLHQVLQIAVDDDFIRNNPSDNVLRELKKAHCFQSEKRRALTKPEQELFLNFLKTHPVYEHWYPVFAVMIGTGLRVGEVTGLRWCDIDMESGMIGVNHTLV